MMSNLLVVIYEVTKQKSALLWPRGVFGRESQQECRRTYSYPANIALYFLWLLESTILACHAMPCAPGASYVNDPVPCQ